MGATLIPLSIFRRVFSSIPTALAKFALVISFEILNSVTLCLITPGSRSQGLIFLGTISTLPQNPGKSQTFFPLFLPTKDLLLVGSFLLASPSPSPSTSRQGYGYPSDTPETPHRQGYGYPSDTPVLPAPGLKNCDFPPKNGPGPSIPSTRMPNQGPGRPLTPDHTR